MSIKISVCLVQNAVYKEICNYQRILEFLCSWNWFIFRSVDCCVLLLLNKQSIIFFFQRLNNIKVRDIILISRDSRPLGAYCVLYQMILQWTSQFPCYGDIARQEVEVQHNTEDVSPNHFCRGETISITYSECVSLSLFVQHTKRMPPIVLSSVNCLTVPYFFHMSHKRHDFRKKKVFDHKMFSYFLYNFSLKHFSF